MHDLKVYIEKLEKLTGQKVILEGKQVGIIYHVTGVYGALEIFKTNTLIGFKEPDGSGVQGISVTRNKNFIYDKRNFSTRIQIVLDGNKISHNYKIVPYDYWQGQYRKPNPTQPQIQDEDEEIILTPQGNLNNLSKYVLSVNIQGNKKDEKIKQLIALLDSKQIKWQIVQI